MFDNPQQEVKNMSKKLRPIKLSDEEFELFYKEIYAEFGPKDVPPVVVNPKVEEIPAEPVVEEIPAEPVAEEVPQEIPAEPIYAPAEEPVQEEAVKAAAVICDVQEDEFIQEEESGAKPKKSRSVPALIVILCLEALAIAGVAAYWLLHMN